MKANDFIIEGLTLEVETIKKTRQLQERQHLDEAVFLPFIVAAAAALIRVAAQAGAAWVLTELGTKAIEGWMDRIRRSNFDPRSPFIPEGMKVFAQVQDVEGSRKEYRFENGQWKEQGFMPGPNNTLVPDGNFRPVGPDTNMNQIIEGAMKKRSWLDRRLGRRAKGELIDISQVEQSEMRYVTELADQERRESKLPPSVRRNSELIRQEYNDQLRQNPDSMRSARSQVRAEWSERLGPLIGSIYGILGLYAYLYQAGELITAYNEQYVTGIIKSRAEYEEKVSAVKDSIKGMVVVAIVPATAIAIVASILGVAFKTNKLKGYWATVAGTLLIAAASAVVMNDQAQQLIIDFTNSIWDWPSGAVESVPVAGAMLQSFDNMIDTKLGDLLQLLGFEDIIRQLGSENIERRTQNVQPPSRVLPVRDWINSL